MDLKKVKTGNFVLDGVVKVLAGILDKTDLDEKLIAGLAKIQAAVDFRQVAALMAASPAVKDKALFKEGILLLGDVLERAGELEGKGKK